jgi:hypothetical protein
VFGALAWRLLRGAYQDVAEAMATALERGGVPPQPAAPSA